MPDPLNLERVLSNQAACKILKVTANNGTYMRFVTFVTKFNF